MNPSRTDLRRAIADALEQLGFDPWVVGSLEEVGAFFGVSVNAVRKWRRRNPAMPGKAGHGVTPGVYDLRKIHEWWRQNIAKIDEVEEDPRSAAEADRRAAWLKVEHRELELAERRGELVSLADVTRLVMRADAHAIALFEQIPDRLLGLLPPGAKAADKRRFLRDAHRAIDSVIDAQRQKLEDLADEYGAEAEAAGED